MIKRLTIVFAIFVLFLSIAACSRAKTKTANATARGAAVRIKIVAAENFYGNIASQLGGDRVSVKSIITNPNSDPHEYEPSVADGMAIAKADIVIKNGLQYDTWMNKMISATSRPGRIVITAGDIAPYRLPYNPHVWYGTDNVWAVAKAITAALEKQDPACKPLFEKNLARFGVSMEPIREKISKIRAGYAGTPAGLTETIFLYQTKPMGLHVLTPFGFEKAIAEGNDPSAADVAEANRQVDKKEIRILIYNSQAATPITKHLLDAARARGIPVVPVSETMPPGDTYQSWMMAELQAVEGALAAARRMRGGAEASCPKNAR